MQARRLRHRVHLQRHQITQDADSGAVSEAWVNVAEVWAEIVPMSGREFVSAASVQAGVTDRLTIRWRDGVVPAMRVLHQTDVYDIKAVLPDPTFRRHITLMCQRGVNDG